MGKPEDMPVMAGKNVPEDRAGVSRNLSAEAEKKVVRSAGKPSPLKKLDRDKLVHELEVHQVELELQNEELRRSQEEMEAAKERYFELNDLAPVGYFSISGKGLILEANLTGANMLGIAQRDIRTQRFSSFIFTADQDIFYLNRRQLLEAKILAVADVVEAVASHRPYRPALGVDKALEEQSNGRASFMILKYWMPALSFSQGRTSGS